MTQHQVGLVTHPESQRSIEVFVEQGAVGMTVSFRTPSFTFRIDPPYARELAGLLTAAADRADKEGMPG